MPTERALHVVDATMFWSPTGGGVRRYLLTKHAWFASRPQWRHTIAVPAVRDGADDPATATLPSWPLPGSGGYRLPVSRRSIAQRIAALEPDVVEVGDPYRVAWAALDAARECGAATVAFSHTNLEAMARLAAGRIGAAVARRYARRLYRRFDLVLAPSPAMQRHLADWGVDGAAVQPLGVDTERFHPRHARAGWKASLGLEPGARVLVYAGRFAAEKHLPVLVDAVKQLGAPYVLVVIGAGPRPPEASDRVRVVPFVAGTDALAEALASADGFVHAGDQETFGLSALEAMACGTPVVVRRAEGLAQWVASGSDGDVSGVGGIGVDHGSGAAFAEAIESLFASDHDAMRAAARRRAEGYAWPRVLAELTARYLALRNRRLAAEDRPREPREATTAEAAR